MSCCTASQLPECAPYGRTSATVAIQSELDKVSPELWTGIVPNTITKWIREIEAESITCAENDVQKKFLSFNQKIFKGTYEAHQILELNRLFLKIGQTKIGLLNHQMMLKLNLRNMNKRLKFYKLKEKKHQ
jgi:hypothetical protein